MPSPVRTRRRPEPEVIVQLQGQLPKLQDATEVDDAEPVSQVRTVWPGREAILGLFAEAQRLKA